MNTETWYDHCERHGHTKEICYKLVGYPKNNKNTNREKGKVVANSVQVTDGPTTSTANNNGFTAEQLKVLQEMTAKPTVAGINNLILIALI